MKAGFNDRKVAFHTNDLQEAIDTLYALKSDLSFVKTDDRIVQIRKKKGVIVSIIVEGDVKDVSAEIVLKEEVARWKAGFFIGGDILDNKISKVKKYLEKYRNSKEVFDQFMKLMSFKNKKEFWIVLTFVATYIISPIDLIPDILPFSGFIDDAILIAAAIDMLRRNEASLSELKRSFKESFKKFKNKKNQKEVWVWLI